MIQPIDYTLHTHTVGFDGQNTPEIMVNTAIRQGFETIGFSNHFIVHPQIKKSNFYQYAVRGKYEKIYNDDVMTAIKRFSEHYADVRALREKYLQINILCGMEMDWFKYDGWQDMANYAIRQLQPDYVIGAMHFIDNGEDGLLNVHDIKNAPEPKSKQLLREYYQNLIQLANFDWRNMGFKFNWIAHFDLPKKVRLSMPDMEYAAFKELRMNSMPVELNTSLVCNSRYDMNESVYDEIFDYQNNISVLVSDDAHNDQQIGAKFDQILEMVKETRTPNICISSRDLNEFVNIKIH